MKKTSENLIVFFLATFSVLVNSFSFCEKEKQKFPVISFCSFLTKFNKNSYYENASKNLILAPFQTSFSGNFRPNKNIFFE